MKQAHRQEIYAIAARFKEIDVESVIEGLQAIEEDLDNQIDALEADKDEAQERLNDLDELEEMDDAEEKEHETLTAKVQELESSMDVLTSLSEEVNSVKGQLRGFDDFESRIDDAAGQEDE